MQVHRGADSRPALGTARSDVTSHLRRDLTSRRNDAAAALRRVLVHSSVFASPSCEVLVTEPMVRRRN